MTTPPTTDPTAWREFAQCVANIAARDGVGRQIAMSRAAREHPAAHAAWRDAGYPTFAIKAHGRAEH